MPIPSSVFEGAQDNVEIGYQKYLPSDLIFLNLNIDGLLAFPRFAR